MTTVREIMTKKIYGCRIGAPLSEAAQIMWDHDCGAVPILDEHERPIAMLTDRDICMAAHFSGQPLSALTVGGAMSKQLWSCGPDDTIEAAEAIMRERQIRRIPVVDDERLVGIVTMNDLVRAAADHEPFDEVEATMAAIGRPRFGEDGSYASLV